MSINTPGSFVDPYGASGQPDPFPFDPAQVSKDFQFTLPVNTAAFDANFRTGHLQQWSLTLERQLPASSMIRIAYVGNRGVKLWASRDINYARYVPGASTVSNYNGLQVTFNKRYSHGFTILA